MNFLEAVKAAASGAIVRHKDWHEEYKLTAEGNVLRCGMEYGVCHIPQILSDGWYVHAPKRYSFDEAYRMMKAGKWMRPVTKSYRFKCNSGYWWSYSPHEGERHRAPCLEPSDIESEWEEVIP